MGLRKKLTWVATKKCDDLTSSFAFILCLLDSSAEWALPSKGWSSLPRRKIIQLGTPHLWTNPIFRFRTNSQGLRKIAATKVRTLGLAGRHFYQSISNAGRYGQSAEGLLAVRKP